MLKAKNTFFVIWRLGYAKDTGGRIEVREQSLAVHFPNTSEGKWIKLFWRFYWKITKKGYLQPLKK
jgi:hypothetical protein